MCASRKPPSRRNGTPGPAPRLALVGCGAIAELFYLPALARHPSVMANLILVDRDIARAGLLAGRFGAAECLADYRDIGAQRVDGVIVAVPDHLHHPVAMFFLSRGVHALCEKPLATSAAEGEELVRAAHDAGRVIAVNYTRRLFGACRKVKELLAAGAIGRPLSLRYSEGFSFRWPTASGYYFDWRVSRRGVLTTQGSHALDLVCWWLGGKPTLVSFQHDSLGGREALAQVQFRYQECAGEVRLSFLNKLPDRYVIEGEAGAIEGSTYDSGSIAVRDRAGKTRTIEFRADPSDYFDFGQTLVDNFLDTIVSGAQPLIAGGEVLDSLRFLDECYAGGSAFPSPWYDRLETLHVG